MNNIINQKLETNMYNNQKYDSERIQTNLNLPLNEVIITNIMIEIKIITIQMNRKKSRRSPKLGFKH